MKKLILTIICLFLILAMVSNAQSRWKAINSNKSTLDSLKTELSKIETNIEQGKSQFKELQNRNNGLERKLDNHIELQNTFSGNISNQLDTLNSGLTVWGIIFGILGVLLAAYITYMQYVTRQLLTKTEQAKREVELIQTDINSNLNLIFDQLTQKEIDYILNRLKNVPEDIIHLFSPLASKRIEDKYFYQFKDLVLNLDESKYSNTISQLLILIAQHFPHRMVFDNDLFESLKRHWKDIAGSFYKEEMRLFLLSYTDRINKNGLDKDELNILMTQLNKLHPELTVELLYENLRSKSQKKEMAIFLNANKFHLFDKLDNAFHEKYKNEYSENAYEIKENESEQSA